MSQTRLSLGQIIDAEGVSMDLDDGDLVAGAVVLLKIVKGTTGQVTIGIGRSEAADWMLELALLQAGLSISQEGFVPREYIDCDDDD